MYAVHRGSMDLARLLVEHAKADVNHVCRGEAPYAGRSPILHAALMADRGRGGANARVRTSSFAGAADAHEVGGGSGGVRGK